MPLLNARRIRMRFNKEKKDFLVLESRFPSGMRSERVEAAIVPFANEFFNGSCEEISSKDTKLLSIFLAIFFCFTWKKIFL